MEQLSLFCFCSTAPKTIPPLLRSTLCALLLGGALFHLLKKRPLLLFRALLQKRPHLSFRALFLGRTPACVLQSAPKKTTSLIQSTFSWAHPGHCPPCSKKDRFSYSEHFCLDAHHPSCSKNDHISHSEQFFFCVCRVVSGWALLQKRPHLSFRALFLGRTPSCVLQKRPLLLFGALLLSTHTPHSGLCADNHTSMCTKQALTHRHLCMPSCI